MAGEENTPFWEIAGLALSVLQMVIYLRMLSEYEDKLVEYAEKLDGWAEDDERVYKELREKDDEFYDYYRSLPEYSECFSAVDRAKGVAFHAYGQTLTTTNRVTRGYTPLARVHNNNMIADRQHATSVPALTRASTLTAERRRRDEHLLEKWRAIVDAPVGVEGYNPAIMSSVISESFKSIKMFAHGFNSAGAAFGTQLYKVLS